MIKAKSLKKLKVIKEMFLAASCSLDRRKLCSQEQISLITYSFFNDFAPLPPTLTFQNAVM